MKAKKKNKHKQDNFVPKIVSSELVKSVEAPVQIEEPKKDIIDNKELKISTEKVVNNLVQEKKLKLDENILKVEEIKPVSNSLSAALLLPMSVVFLSIALSASLIISASIIARSLKDSTLSINGSNNTNQAAAAQPTAQPSQPTTQVSLDQIKSIFNGNNIKFGDANRKVLFVEISDPSCPYCHIAGGKNSELNKQAGQQFLLVKDGGTYVSPVEEMRKLTEQGQASYAWVYSNGHGNGQIGAEALYCAYEKGKFWDVQDILMSNAGYNLLNNTVKNDRSQASKLAELTKDAMNSDDMLSCINSGKYTQKLTESQALASSLGVSGTPGFFVNNTNFAGAYSYKDMESVVTAALK
ncbi:MAG: thioredoxin domain-containing protein [bacterium]